jgi:branched-chain amino acid transport system ATP-binding protein
MNPKLPLLSLQHICAGYGPIAALREVSLDVYEKEIVTLIGANGAGKTSLLMSIFSQPRISTGAIVFAGSAIHHLPTHEISSLGIAIAPERRRIFAKMSVHENLLMGAYKKSPSNVQKNLSKVFEYFPILKDRQYQRAGTLSGGEQQMLSMGRSLMSEPTLFLLDEPSLGLAPQIVNQLFNILKEIAQNGTTILLVEQNAHHALNLADRGYVLVNGEIQLTGTGQQLLANPQVQTAYLGGSFNKP